MLIFSDNGIKSIEDLVDVKEDDINSFCLNYGEKKRVMNLLYSLCKSSPGILRHIYHFHSKQLVVLKVGAGSCQRTYIAKQASCI